MTHPCPLEEATYLKRVGGVFWIEIGFRSCLCDDCGERVKLRSFIRNRLVYNDICNECAAKKQEPTK